MQEGAQLLQAAADARRRAPEPDDLGARYTNAATRDSPGESVMSVLTHGLRWVVSREGRIVETVRSSQT